MSKTEEITLTTEILIKKRSVYNKVLKSIKLFQHYKNLWYILFLKIKEHGFRINDYLSIVKMKQIIDGKLNIPIDNIEIIINNIKELYKNEIGADTCKTLHNMIIREIKSVIGKWKNGKKSSLPKPRKLDRIYTFTLDVNPNMINDKRFSIRNPQNKTVVRLCKKYGAIKFPIPKHLIDFDKLHIKIQFNIDCPIRILFVYKLNNIMEKSETINSDYILSIDFGINNLMTCFSNNSKLKTFIFDGKYLKTINQLINKLHADDKLNITDKRRLWQYRNRLIKSVFHYYTNKFVEICEQFNINKVIIPKTYTQIFQVKSKLSSQSEQIIRMIPIGKLINILKYKLKLANIEILEKYDESYTSTISCFDKENIEKIIGKNYSEIDSSELKSKTKRKKGLFVDPKLNKQFHADINGAINIMQKYIGYIMNKIQNINVKLNNPVIIYYNKESQTSLLIGKVGIA